MNFKDSKVAKVVMIIMIVSSIVGGGVRSIKHDVNQIEKTFYERDQDDIAIDEELTLQISSGYNLITIASKYTDTTNLKNALSALKQSNDINEKYELQLAVIQEFNAVINTLSNTQLTNEDERLKIKLNNQFNSSQQLIERDNYNLKAIALNEDLDRFPASIFCKLPGVNKVPLFK